MYAEHHDLLPSPLRVEDSMAAPIEIQPWSLPSYRYGNGHAYSVYALQMEKASVPWL